MILMMVFGKTPRGGGVQWSFQSTGEGVRRLTCHNYGHKPACWVWQSVLERWYKLGLDCASTKMWVIEGQREVVWIMCYLKASNTKGNWEGKISLRRAFDDLKTVYDRVNRVSCGKHWDGTCRSGTSEGKWSSFLRSVRQESSWALAAAPIWQFS